MQGLKCQILFSGENTKKNIWNCRLLKFVPSMHSVKRFYSVTYVINLNCSENITVLFRTQTWLDYVIEHMTVDVAVISDSAWSQLLVTSATCTRPLERQLELQ